jgi:hypothetical protein
MAARRTADRILAPIRKGALPAKLNADWRGPVSWSCLTDNFQIARSRLLLYEKTLHESYRAAAYGLRRAVGCRLQIDDAEGTRSAVKNSFPIYVSCGQFECVNWATRFAIDWYTTKDRIAGGRRQETRLLRFERTVIPDARKTIAHWEIA